MVHPRSETRMVARKPAGLRLPNDGDVSPHARRMIDPLHARRRPRRPRGRQERGPRMKDHPFELIEVDQLQVGMFVHLDLGWTEHPFPFNSFRIRNADQIETIRSLGLVRLRCSPGRSEREPKHPCALADEQEAMPSPIDPIIPASADLSPPAATLDADRALLQAQQTSLERCERGFAEAARGYRRLLQQVRAQPDEARAEAGRVVGAMLDEIAGEQDVAIRLLSERAGEESALHALNSVVLSLLLARACGRAAQLAEIGAGALLHDIGLIELPDHLRWREQHLSAAERRLYQEHVAHGLRLAERMDLPAGVREIIAQHHELADGTGYPAQLSGDAIAPGSRIVCVVNAYDNLCNPDNPALALTPHDALAVMFARMRGRFDVATMAIFIRMMGVYPPGSIVQLTDGRYGLSVSVNAARPLKPKIVVYAPDVAPDDAPLLDLERAPAIGVQRSLKPTQLPRAVFDYLSPRRRMCYFFERSRDGGATEADA